MPETGEMLMGDREKGETSQGNSANATKGQLVKRPTTTARSQRERDLLKKGREYFAQDPARRDPVGNRYDIEAKNTGQKSQVTDQLKEAAQQVNALGTSAPGMVAAFASKALTGADAVNATRNAFIGVSAAATQNERATNKERNDATEKHMQHYAFTKRGMHSDFDEYRELEAEPSVDVDEEKKKKKFLGRARWHGAKNTLISGIKAAAYAKASGKRELLAPEIDTVASERGPEDEGKTAKELVEKGNFVSDLGRKARPTVRQLAAIFESRDLRGAADLRLGYGQKLNPQRQEKLDQGNDRLAELDAKKFYNKDISEVGIRTPQDDAKRYHKAEVKKLQDEAENRKKERPHSEGKGILSAVFGTKKPIFTADEQQRHAGAQKGFNDATASAQRARGNFLLGQKSALKKLRQEHKAPNVNKNSKPYIRWLQRQPKEVRAQHDEYEKNILESSRPATPESLKQYMGNRDDAEAARSHWSTKENLESIRDTNLSLDEKRKLDFHNAQLEEIKRTKKTGLDSRDRMEHQNLVEQPQRLAEQQKKENTAFKVAGDRKVTNGMLTTIDSHSNPADFESTTKEKIAKSMHGAAETLYEASMIGGGKAKDTQALADADRLPEAQAAAASAMARETLSGISNVAPGLGHGVGAAWSAATGTTKAIGAAGMKMTESDARKFDTKELYKSVADGTRAADTRPVNWSHVGRQTRQISSPSYMDIANGALSEISGKNDSLERGLGDGLNGAANKLNTVPGASVDGQAQTDGPANERILGAAAESMPTAVSPLNDMDRKIENGYDLMENEATSKRDTVDSEVEAVTGSRLSTLEQGAMAAHDAQGKGKEVSPPARLRRSQPQRWYQSHNFEGHKAPQPPTPQEPTPTEETAERITEKLARPQPKTLNETHDYEGLKAPQPPTPQEPTPTEETAERITEKLATQQQGLQSPEVYSADPMATEPQPAPPAQRRGWFHSLRRGAGRAWNAIRRTARRVGTGVTGMFRRR